MTSLLSLVLKIPIKSSLLSRATPLTSCHHRRPASGQGFGGNKYIDSPDESSPENYTTVVKSYEEWKFVERLLAPRFVPDPPTDPSQVFPSGWKPPAPPALDTQYYIPRTKNHMVPVYCKELPGSQGLRKWTRIKNVEGNIWALEQDVGRHLKRLYPTRVVKTWLNESFRIVYIHGDHEKEIRDWVMSQGF